jgi:hypothetical protein
MTIVGTWNLENLFRPGDDGPSGEEGYDAKLDSLAATITDLAPDLLAVQEVGDPDALDDLVTRLDGDWHTALADPDARGIRVGILSRHALSDVEQVPAAPRPRCRSTTTATPSTNWDGRDCGLGSTSTSTAPASRSSRRT